VRYSGGVLGFNQVSLLSSSLRYLEHIRESYLSIMCLLMFAIRVIASCSEGCGGIFPGQRYDKVYFQCIKRSKSLSVFQDSIILQLIGVNNMWPAPGRLETIAESSFQFFLH
jgi:hypothetical protein